QNPEGHVTAVGPAESSQTIRISDAARDHGIDARHAIFVIAFAPGILVCLGKSQSFAGGSAKVWLQHGKAVGREYLNRIAETINGGPGRSAMWIEQKGNFRSRLIARRL